MAKNEIRRMAKIPKGCIYSPPFSVVDDTNNANIMSAIKMRKEIKNTRRLNFSEIIYPSTTIARTYSALFTATSIKRFFSLALNFIYLILEKCLCGVNSVTHYCLRFAAAIVILSSFILHNSSFAAVWYTDTYLEFDAGTLTQTAIRSTSTTAFIELERQGESEMTADDKTVGLWHFDEDRIF